MAGSAESATDSGVSADPPGPAGPSSPAGPGRDPGPGHDAAASPERLSWLGPRLVGGVLLALGVVALIATFDIPSARDGWSIQGPRFAPLLASIALVLLSLSFLIRTIIRPDVELARHAAT